MFFLKLLLLITLFCSYSKCLTCKNENNEPVDWFYLYKLPKEHSSNYLINNGTAYMYMTSKDYQTGWKLSNISINNFNSIPGLTVQPFYNHESLMYIFYNDETPVGSKNDKLGHTKGILMSNESTGYWLIHSVPEYPSTDKYFYPQSGVKNGQSFLCITMNLDNINNVGKQLQYNEPQIYESYISKHLQNKLENVNAVIEHQKIKVAPWYRLTSLRSLDSEEFITFAKSGKFGKEIYGDWVAPTLKSDLLVESWLNGNGRIPSNCKNIYRVNNVESINLNYVSFSSGKDHSKWAVTKSKAKNWICVGDINREEHQKVRGGGTICINKQELWSEYQKTITETELCK